PAASPPATDPDRAAAEKLLSQFDLDILPAGKTEVLKLKAGSPVPAGTFAVIRVRCWSEDPLPKTFADEVLFPAVAPLARLVSLEDSGSKVEMGKADPAKWAGLATKESLQQFELAVPLSDGWIDTFRQFPKLTAVHVHEAKKVPVATLKRLTELKALDSLRITSIEGLDRWEAITVLPLKKLGVSVAPNMDAAACERIAAMPALGTVSFYDIAFTGEMLAVLAPAPKLRSLTFTKCKLPATGYDHLARMPNLGVLNIKGNDFGDVQLAQFAEAKNIQFVSVKETAVTEAGAKALAAKRPNLTIEWSGGRVKGR
ncbi:MAG: hypothetical protein JNK93_06480, partial [Planctomycetia bacterium]|nr:hypothetical protein [Planctomycetia bacterium]